MTLLVFPFLVLGKRSLRYLLNSVCSVLLQKIRPTHVPRSNLLNMVYSKTSMRTKVMVNPL